MYGRLGASAAAVAASLFIVLSTGATVAQNPSVVSELALLTHDWEHVKLQISDRDQRERMMEQLARKAGELVKKYPTATDPVIWVGIITSEQASLAKENGSLLKALGLARKAREILEKAEKIDPVAMDAGAPTSLGVLYSQVPAFPVAFGDNSKARYYLQEAIKNAPNGLDANYFYGKFLYEQAEYTAAIKVLQRALTLPELQNRPIWDRSLRIGIQQMIADILKRNHR